jgi:spore maturation protein CgeB
LARGHGVQIFEPEDSWSRENLVRHSGPEALTKFEEAFPQLRSERYKLADLNLERALEGSHLVIAHEWNDPQLISALCVYRRQHPEMRLLFHDTHHRAITAPQELARFDLSEYDAVLAYGASLKDAYERQGWGRQVHVWHEAADTRVFYPRPSEGKAGDLVWIGNWGDEERSEELREFLLQPVRRLSLTAKVHGVRYPDEALRELEQAGISYGGWLPNFQVPEVFSRFRVTVHVPRRPYLKQLRGIPTIRPFEAMACGIPMVSAPWEDSEGLFRQGRDFLVARDGSETEELLRNVLRDEGLAASLARSGLETIRQRHTCGHRVDQLMEIYGAMKPDREPSESNRHAPEEARR